MAKPYSSRYRTDAEQRLYGRGIRHNRQDRRQLPIADIAASVESGASPLEVTFSFGGAYQAAGEAQEPVAISWDFGDGASDPAGDVTAIHTYGAAGTFTAILTLTTSTGESVSDEIDIVVS